MSGRNSNIEPQVDLKIEYLVKISIEKLRDSPEGQLFVDIFGTSNPGVKAHCVISWHRDEWFQAFRVNVFHDISGPDQLDIGSDENLPTVATL